MLLFPKVVASMLLMYSPTLSPARFKTTSISLPPSFLSYLVKIHKISIFGKISLDFLCEICYNTNTRIIKVLQKHSAHETTNFISVILCNTMQTVADSLPDTQPQSRIVIRCGFSVCAATNSFGKSNVVFRG